MLVSNLLLSKVEYLPWSTLRIMLQVGAKKMDNISQDGPGANKTISDKFNIETLRKHWQLQLGFEFKFLIQLQ